MGARLVLHVLPIDLARGAQTYARELRNALDGPLTHHRTLTLFRSESGALDPDISLAVRPGLSRRAGLDPVALFRLRRVLRQQEPDVVVAHGSEPLKYTVFAGVPQERLAYYKIGIGGERLTGPRRRLHRMLLGRAGAIAAVSADAAGEAVALGVSADRVRVIPNGRDPSRFRRREEVGDRARPRLVFVGHLTESKRPERFVEVIRALRADGFDGSAAVAGDGPLFTDLQGPAARAAVEMLGRVDDVPDVLSGADVFVFTSVSEGEGMPGVLIEAGLAGLAVVTTDVPGARAVISDEETGFVVPVDDFPALVRACRALVADVDLRSRFGAAARIRCERDFSLEASVRQWEALLAAIDGRPCTSST